MNPILCRQMSLDYCCSPEDVSDRRNHFTEHRFLAGRRTYQEDAVCVLKAAVINGKLLFTGRPDLLAWCKEQYETCGSEWFFEIGELRRLDARLREDGYRIRTVHPFFIAERPTDADAGGCELRWYRGGEIEQFRGDGRFDEAFAFRAEAPDVLGLAALRDGEILGMAGASCDSPTIWQIGINVEPESRGAGIGTMLVSLLKNEILSRGILPFYGTSMSHLASQRLALAAGFVPAWAELITEKIQP